MSKMVQVISGIFVLIGIYLFLSQGDKTVKIISTLASNATKGIAVLQGRAVSTINLNA